MSTVDFLPFANGTDSPNVLSQASYVSAQSAGLWGDVGFTAGVAYSSYLNKVWRQSSVMTAALAHAISGALGVDVLDSGGPSAVTALTAQLLSTMAAAATAAVPPIRPQGRLTLTTNTPALQTDVAGATVVYYTAHVGNYLPIWTGTQFNNYQFASDLTLTLTGAASGSACVDVFAINQAGSAVLGFGPVWANSSAGAGARGTGAGTTQLARINGIWANANTITLLNGANTYSGVPAYTATYLGSLNLDATAGRVSCYTSYGQSRKWGVWNAYNRLPIVLRGGDPTASWTLTGGAWRALNGNSANSLQLFTGLPEDPLPLLNLTSMSQGGDGTLSQTGIGWNSTSAPSGTAGHHQQVQYGGSFPLVSQLVVPPSLGVNVATALEYASNNTVFGTESYSALTSIYTA